MNAVSIQGEPASTLCETPEKTEFFRLAESYGRTERWNDGGEKGWHRRARDGSMRRALAGCSQSVWTDITCDWDFISGNATCEMPHAAGRRATAAPYATPPHRNIKRTCAPSRARNGIRSAALCGFSGQGSGSWRACFRAATLVFRPAAPASLCGPDVRFWSCRIPARSGSFEAWQRNPEILPVFLMFSALINHQPSSNSSNSSKLLGDWNTSATAIWDPIILLYDTLNVSSNNLVHIGVSGDSKGESLLFLDVWALPALYKWHPVLFVMKV